MNRMDRLLAIIWLLRTRPKLKAEELAEIFGVTTRTIYRDIQALAEANVPVISLPGPDGGYSLMKEYAVTPITFTDQEVAALYLGANFLNATRLGPLGKAIRTAIEKIARVLPEAQLRRLQTLQQAILPEIGGHVLDEWEIEYFQKLEQAVVDGVTVRARYRTPDGAETEREIDPYGLVYQAGYWYAVGYCHLRQAMRMFRLDRFLWLELTERRFQRPAGFSLEPFLFRTAEEQELQNGPWETVRLRCTPDWIGYFEAHAYYRRCNLRRDGEDVLLDVPRGGLWALVNRVLESRGRIAVLEPPELRRQVLELAQAVVNRHRDPVTDALPDP